MLQKDPDDRPTINQILLVPEINEVAREIVKRDVFREAFLKATLKAYRSKRKKGDPSLSN